MSKEATKTPSAKFDLRTFPTTVNEDDLWACPVADCGKTFALKQSLTRHLNGTHDAGIPTKPHRTPKQLETPERAAIKAATAEAVAGVRSTLTDMVMPLREQLRLIEGRLEILSAEAAALRAAKADAEAVLRRLDPTFAPVTAAKGASGGNAARTERQHTERLAAVRMVLSADADELRNGFTTNLLIEKVKKRGLIGMTHSTAERVMDELRESGEIRLDRVTRGGGQSYMLIGANGNGSHA